MFTSRSGRTAVLVLGMHRSGTSALGGVLARLGVRTPTSLMGGDVDNPKGYFEAAALAEFHDRVLRASGGSWRDWAAWDTEFLKADAGRSFQNELRELLWQEYGDAEIFLVKDPRICRLLPLWRPVLDELGVRPAVVVPLRNPREVARSLNGRSRLTASVPEAGLAWIRHVLDVEAQTREMPRVFTRYEHLLDDWRGQVDTIASRLDLSWPVSVEEASAAVTDFLDPTLRHHMATKTANSADAIDHLALQVYGTVQILVENPHAAGPMAALDRIRSDFDAATTLFDPLVSNLQATHAAKLTAAEDAATDLSRLHATALEEHAAEIRRARGEIQDLDEVIGRLHARLEERTRKADNLVETVHVMAANERKLRRESLELEAELRDRFIELADMTRRLLSVDRDTGLVIRGLQEEVAALARLVRSRRHAVRRLVPPSRVVARSNSHETLEEDRALIRASALFNPIWYLRHYHDVQATGVPPAVHYLTKGAAEGRDPGPTFSTRTYLERYPDVAESGMNPLVHYLRIGRYQGRVFLQEPTTADEGGRARA